VWLIVVRFLPNEVYLLEPVLKALNTPKLQWQTTYILLLWLSLICLAPFDLASIDSTTGNTSLVKRLIELTKRGLGSAGKERDACAILGARVLSRSDVWQQELPSFMTWAVEIFTSDQDTEPNRTLLLVNHYSSSLTQKTGVLATISNILTHSERQIGQSIIPQAVEIIDVTDDETNPINTNALARKFRVKIMQRIGLIELPALTLHENDEIPETLNDMLGHLLSSLSDKVPPPTPRVWTNSRTRLSGIQLQKQSLKSSFVSLPPEQTNSSASFSKIWTRAS